MGEKTHIRYYIIKPSSYQLKNQYVDRKNSAVFAILLIATAIISQDAPLSDWEKQGNRTRARIRSRVEHVFGAQLARAGRVLVRTIGLARATVKIGLMNLAYNMARLGFLMRSRG